MVRHRGRVVSADRDLVALEAPLQVLVDDEPFAVVMRTPGDDVALTLGFLFAERLISRIEDVASCADDILPSGAHAVRAVLAPHVHRPRDARATTSSAACGVCGTRSVESLTIEAPHVDAGFAMAASAIAELPGRLRGAQATFDATGGLHAAALFTADGTLVDHAEDVGRHNAVDKVIGRALQSGRVPLGAHALFVSGRTSYEIVQKAWLAGVPLVAAVSAPSSLAIDMAGEAGITLLGFVRGGTCNVYTHPHRVR